MSTIQDISFVIGDADNTFFALANGFLAPFYLDLPVEDFIELGCSSCSIKFFEYIFFDFLI